MEGVINESPSQRARDLLQKIKQNKPNQDQVLSSSKEFAISSIAQQSFKEIESMKTARKQTFINWPHIKPSADDMSSNGWFSCKIVDRVICIYCDTICHQWSRLDDPEEVHRRLAPRCPFILSKSSQSSNNTPKTVNENLNDICQPRHTNMCQMTQRLKSFEKPSWTLSSPSPDDLAQAGFYYSGNDNIVTCFYCDGSLHQWGPNDKPNIEHARWFSNCLYARHLCGDHLYDRIQSAKQQLSKKSSTIDDEMLKRLVNARLDLPIVQRLLTQYSLAVIKRCLEDQLKLNQDDFSSDSELAMNCFLLQKQLDVIKGNPKCIIIPSKSQISVDTNKTSDAKPQDCLVCLTEERQVACMPCGHFCTCTCCGYSLSTCPMCRTKIQSFVRIYC